VIYKKKTTESCCDPYTQTKEVYLQCQYKVVCRHYVSCDKDTDKDVITVPCAFNYCQGAYRVSLGPRCAYFRMRKLKPQVAKVFTVASVMRDK